MVWKFLLQLQSLLPPPALRPFTILRGCYDLYGPLTWLLLYYPLLYLSKVAKRLTILTARRNTEISHNGKPARSSSQSLYWIPTEGSFEATTVSIVVLGALLNVLLSRYCFLNSGFWRWNRSTQSQLGISRDTGEEDDHMSSDEVPNHFLHTSIESGLSKDEVVARQKAHGPNKIGHKRNWGFVLLGLSIGPANLLLEAAAVLAVVFQDWRDLLVLCGLLALNIRGAIQKVRASDEVIQTLIGDIRATATVLRDGKISDVNATVLVPGDIVHVSEGEIVTADCRVVSLDGTLHVDQSNITGESDPVKKQLGDICYAYTGIRRGEATLMVIGTGYQTFCGRTATLIEAPMPARQSMAKIVIPRYVSEYQGVLRSIGAVVFALILVPISFSRISENPSRISHQILEILVSLAIVGVPASQDLYVSLFRSSGAARLKDGGGVAQKLEGVECLAGIDILCCDKTGTITGNDLTLAELYCISCDPEDLVLTAFFGSSPDKQKLDPIQKTFTEALKQYPQVKANSDQYKVLNHEPFNVDNKRYQSSVQSPLGDRMLCVLGTPKAVLDIYLQDHADEEDALDIAKNYKAAAAEFARCGLRSLGVARKRENDKWKLLGLAPMFDSPRLDSASAVLMAKALGVSVKMLTGDSAVNAKASAQSVGIGVDVLESEFLNVKGNVPTSTITTRLEAADTYAEVFPEHKEKIVRALQNRGYMVGVTGDGLNDTSTLRRAYCGIAVEGATEKAQSAADIIFVTPGLSTIVQAIQISRQTFQQAHSYIYYRTTFTLHMLVVILWYFAAYNDVLDVRLLILNTHISDMIGLALQLDSDHADVSFSKKPVRWSARRLLMDVVPLSVVLTIGSWLSVLAMPNQGPSASEYALPAEVERQSAIQAQVVFLHIVLTDHWLSILTSTDGRFWPYPRNRRVLWTLLCADLLVTLLCLVDWAGQGHKLSPMRASWAWLVSFATFCVAAGLRFVLSVG